MMDGTHAITKKPTICITQACSKPLRSAQRRAGFCGSLAGDEGSSLVEFAVVLPMALTLLTGILTFLIYMNQNLELANATSLTGQYLALNRGTSGAADPCKLAVSTFAQVAPGLNSASLKYSFAFNGNPYPNVTSCTGASAYMTQGATAKITVTYPCSLAIYGADLAPGCLLTSQVTEIVQ